MSHKITKPDYKQTKYVLANKKYLVHSKNRENSLKANEQLKHFDKMNQMLKWTTR